MARDENLRLAHGLRESEVTTPKRQVPLALVGLRAGRHGEELGAVLPRPLLGGHQHVAELGVPGCQDCHPEIPHGHREAEQVAGVALQDVPGGERRHRCESDRSRNGVHRTQNDLPLVAGDSPQPGAHDHEKRSRDSDARAEHAHHVDSAGDTGCHILAPSTKTALGFRTVYSIP